MAIILRRTKGEELTWDEMDNNFVELSQPKNADNITEGVNNKLFTSSHKLKLDGIQQGATANRTDAATDLVIETVVDRVAALESSSGVSGVQELRTEVNTQLEAVDNSINELRDDLNVVTLSTANNEYRILALESGVVAGNGEAVAAIGDVAGLSEVLDNKQNINERLTNFINNTAVPGKFTTLEAQDQLRGRNGIHLDGGTGSTTFLMSTRGVSADNLTFIWLTKSANDTDYWGTPTSKGWGMLARTDAYEGQPNRLIYSFFNGTGYDEAFYVDPSTRNFISNWNFSAPTITATAAANTLPPIFVTSRLRVDNLNVELLDGQNGAYYRSWNNATDKPNTLAGYGITDAYTMTAADARLANVEVSISSRALATDLTAHTTSTSNPHNTTAAQVGAYSIAAANTRFTTIESSLAGKANTAHTHTLAQVGITGTPDGTKFLRDDGSWANVPSSGGTTTAFSGADINNATAAPAAADTDSFATTQDGSGNLFRQRLSAVWTYISDKFNSRLTSMVASAAATPLTTATHNNRVVTINQGGSVSIDWNAAPDGFSCIVINNTSGDITPTLTNFTGTAMTSVSGLTKIKAGGMVSLLCTTPNGGTTKILRAAGDLA